jgi:predicted metal-dependent peptidase
MSDAWVRFVRNSSCKDLKRLWMCGETNPPTQVVLSDGSDGTATARIKGLTIMVNREFAEVLKDNELAFLLAHEVGHRCFRHAQRGFEVERAEGEAYNHEAMNIAMDAKVNDALLSIIAASQDGGQWDPAGIFAGPLRGWTVNKVEERFFGGLVRFGDRTSSAVSIYGEIRSTAKRSDNAPRPQTNAKDEKAEEDELSKISAKHRRNEKGKGESSPDEAGGTKDDAGKGEAEGTDADADRKDGGEAGAEGGGGEGEDGDKDKDGGEGGEDAGEGAEGAGESASAQEVSLGTPQEEAAVEAAVASAMQGAPSGSGKAGGEGTLGAFREREVGVRVGFRAPLRRFLSKVNRIPPSFASPDRRFVHTGTCLPGSVGKSSRDVVFAADCSSSVGNATFASFTVLTNVILREYRHFKVTYVPWVHIVIEAGVKQNVGKLEMSRPATGGTRVGSVFAWVERNRKNAIDGLVILSDGEIADWPDTPPPYPVAVFLIDELCPDDPFRQMDRFSVPSWVRQATTVAALNDVIAEGLRGGIQ